MYGYDIYKNTHSSFDGTIVGFIIALAASIIIYFIFMDRNKANSYTGFVKKLYDFLHFRVSLIEVFIKIAYICLAIYLTISSFAFIEYSFLSFILVITLGNLLLRIAFEGVFVIYNIYLNVVEINKKMK